MSIHSEQIELLLQEDLYDYLPPKGASSYQTISAKSFAAQALLSNVFKKFEDNPSLNADAKALEGFLTSNKKAGDDLPKPETMLDDHLLGEFHSLMDSFFHPPQSVENKEGMLVQSMSDLFAEASTGPGASLLANGNDFYTKLFSSPLSTTSEDLYRDYVALVSKIPSWSQAENTRASHLGNFTLVDGNRLGFAPKNVDVSRIIATEPSLNMFFQLGLGRILEQRLRHFCGIDLSTQQGKNRELAQSGSAGKFATLDLSSASDSISFSLAKSSIPKDIFWLFEYLRSPIMTIEREDKKEKLHLNILASMGNGFTFPLETVIFTCIVLSCFKVSGLTPQFPRHN